MTPPQPGFFRVPRLTRLRMALALLVAAGSDIVQLLFVWLGPVDWLFIDPVIDTFAAVVTCWLLGFHILLLPTYVLKLVPLAEDIPTWTACVMAVIALRKRSQRMEAKKLKVEDLGPAQIAPAPKILADGPGTPDQK